MRNRSHHHLPSRAVAPLHGIVGAMMATLLLPLLLLSHGVHGFSSMPSFSPRPLRKSTTTIGSTHHHAPHSWQFQNETSAPFFLPSKNVPKHVAVKTDQGSHHHSHHHQQQQQGGDSIARFAKDIAHVLGTLRSTEDDPSIPLLFHRRSRSPTFTHPWSTMDWEKHYTRSRFLNYLKGFPSSRLLKRIAPQLLLLVGWSALVVALPSTATPNHSWSAKLMAKAALPLTPLSLVSTFVAALLTLRTNQCLARLAEARVAMGQILTFTRQMAQLIASTVYPQDKQAALLAARHVALYTWLVRGQLKGLDGSSKVDDDMICTMLPNDFTSSGSSNDTPSPSAAYVMAHRKKPMAVLAVLRQIFASLQLTTSQASSLDQTVQQLNQCTFTAERILASPIPPLYSAHTGRLLMFNLVFLPLALRGSLHRAATIITTAAVGFAMLGLDEISHLLENPFRLMPLWYLAKNAMKDVGDAILCRPPSLSRVLPRMGKGVESPVNGSGRGTNEEWLLEPPPYW